MADNINVTEGAGKTIATDEVGDRHFQIVKLAHGADGVADIVSATAPLPVSVQEIEIKNDTGSPLPVVEGGLAAPVTGAVMPAGGVGLTGWLSAIWQRLGALLSVTPSMTSGGNLAVQTSAVGATWVTLPEIDCKQLTLINDSGTKISWRQDGGGTALPIFDQAAYTIYSLSDASQISIRRADTGNAQVTLGARWEA